MLPFSERLDILEALWVISWLTIILSPAVIDISPPVVIAASRTISLFAVRLNDPIPEEEIAEVTVISPPLPVVPVVMEILFPASSDELITETSMLLAAPASNVSAYDVPELELELIVIS